MYLFLEAC
jgi:hypothetical protein